MPKTILLTGATDGIGLLTAKKLAFKGHRLLLHGRNEAKLAQVIHDLKGDNPGIDVEAYVADLSSFRDIAELADNVAEHHSHIDVLINNAGVFKTTNNLTQDNLDVRFVVNTLAPYILSKQLLKRMDGSGRVVNLSSAAQASVDLDALQGVKALDDYAAYAQSKLALTMWSKHLADELRESGPAIIAVNPASFLGSKMVQEAYGVAGSDLSIGADILCRAALSDEFNDASGKYFDNDSGQFAQPHSDALNPKKNAQLVSILDNMLSKYI
ncbi:SDR family NAD(P)-dependent oxidoreductase [Thalassotalea mangrovi]|uniref:SDR family NAD(P)-dependent oxidoreductase n=1 Tax=Thalassotalea mangrovi TaxID=2572245 RepID=A0A4U1BAQ6_9GAMM|nr:SDR family NAD(P)-dependent oxidoreductase [Thalassotalea mangrovi]TKB47495.1 SDR family NAD(P)-dependent oxidoreductase [Thalassotalea mangrovi]